MVTTTRSSLLLLWAVVLLLLALPPMWMALALTVTGSGTPEGMPIWGWLVWIVPAIPLALSAGLVAESVLLSRQPHERMSG